MKSFVKLGLILAVSTCIGTANAQRFVGNKVIERTKIGIHGGANWASQTTGTYSYYTSMDYWGNYYTSSGADYTNTKAGFTAGLEMELPIRNGFYVQPEVNYTQMGGKGSIAVADADGNSSSLYGKYNYNYLQVPLLFKYKPSIKGFGIFIGPQYGYLLNANNSIKGYGTDKTVINWSNRNEFSILAGCEYYIPSKNDGPQLGFSLRYMAGLTNVMNKEKYQTLYPSEDISSMGSIRNSSIMLTAGVRF